LIELIKGGFRMASKGNQGKVLKGKSKGPVVVLDIGSKCVKLALFERGKKDLVLKAFSIVKIPPDVILGKDIIDRQVLIDKIRDAYARLGTDTTNVIVNIAGGDVKSKVMVIPFYKKKEKLAEAVDWKIKEELHVDPTEIVRDYEILGMSQIAESVDILVGTAKLSLVYDIMDIIRASGLEPVMITSDLVSLFRVIEALDLKDLPGDNVFFHMGYEVALLVHIKDGQVQQMLEVPSGIKSYVDNLSRFYDLRVEEAEEIAIHGPSPNIERASFEETMGSLHDRFLSPDKFIPALGEPGAKFNFFISGGGSQLYGITSFVKTKYGIDLKTLDVSGLFVVEEPIKELRESIHLLPIVVGDVIHFYKKEHRVNLLPLEGGIEAVGAVKEVSLLPHILGALFIWLLIVVGIIVLTIGTSRRISGLKSQIVSLQAEEAELQKKANEIREYKQEIDDARRKIDLIKQLQVGRTKYVQLLDEVNKVLPSGCWLEALKRNGDYLNISGAALSNMRISQFMTNLRKSPIVDSVSLLSIEVAGSQEEKYASFELNVKLK